MAQQVAPPRSGLDRGPEADTWVPVAIEHYRNSLVPWVGKEGLRWLEERTKPSADPMLVLVAPEVYNLWKAHAIGAGGPFPRDVLRQRPSDGATEGQDSGWRAFLVLGGLLAFAVLFIAILLLIPR